MKDSQYDWDDPNIPEEYYDSEEWMALLAAMNEPPDHEAVYKPKQTHDLNWDLLRNEHDLPPEQHNQVARISNCRVQVWHDSGQPSVTYDVRYQSGQRVLGQHLNGHWTTEEARTPTEARAYDSVLTMLVRSSRDMMIRFTRFYATNTVKTVVRDLNLIEISDSEPRAAWFIVNDRVYPARLDKQGYNCYVWAFNGSNSMSSQEFSDVCWEAV